MKAELIGNIGREPEMRFTKGGAPVLSFSVADNVGKDKTQWVQVTLWEDLATVWQDTLKKGMRVEITGFLQLDTWEGRDGTKQSGLKLSAKTVGVIPKKESVADLQGSHTAEDDEEPF